MILFASSFVDLKLLNFKKRHVDINFSMKIKTFLKRLILLVDNFEQLKLNRRIEICISFKTHTNDTSDASRSGRVSKIC